MFSPTFPPHLFGTIGLGWVESNCTVFSHFVHENGLFHGQSSIFGGVVHENGLFHGQQTSLVEDGFGKVEVSEVVKMVEEEWGLCGEVSEGELLFVVGGGGVEGGGGVVAGDAVFGDEGGYVGVGVAVE